MRKLHTTNIGRKKSALLMKGKQPYTVEVSESNTYSGGISKFRH